MKFLVNLLGGLVMAGTLGAVGCSQTSTDAATTLAVETYFRGLTTGDASIIPLREDVFFIGPMVPEGIRGEAEVRAFLQEIAGDQSTITAERIFADGEYSCAPFELAVPDGPTVSGVDCFRVIEGQIVEIQPYFDPRPLMPQ